MPIASINPATGETMKTFEPLSDQHLEEKLQRAFDTFGDYRRSSFAERAQMMMRAAEILEHEKQEFARVMTLEMGKPIKAAAQEAEKCALVCRYYAENAETHLADEIVKTNATRSYVRFQPLGAVLAVMP
ncbi:MAG TPA: aldehyde dehydrogenase family protein, partial [Pyrinomonadaceae bacterium]|nr:aldehyde dehydrogenase family protein [Pyrinomonadaceae bacterium]